MVVCKYYRQGHCRFGQYCQFEHINTFGHNNKSDSYNEDEYTAVLVAKEILNAERGGQWMLSCFAPLNERPCIPGMEDLSPEEVRWEMYQAQKNGMVEQAKVRFQQLCQDIKAKREALKNPTRETLMKLKEILRTGNKNTTTNNASGKPSSFSFATPQLGTPSSTSSTNVFGNKAFASQGNPFSGGFTSTANSSIFGRTTTTSNPGFGTTPTFGSNLGVFGGGTGTSSVFGATTDTSTFNTGQNAQTFGSSGSIFGGGTTPSVFGQPSMFGASGQTNNVFARPQTSQPATSVFNTGATSTTPLFSGASTQSNNTSIFGGATTSTANPFGGSPNLQTTNSIFGATPTAGTFTSGIFSQSEAPAFGGAPVFGGTATFGNTAGPMFGEKPAFGTSGSIFGGSNAAAPAFSTAQPTSAFGVATSTPAGNIFGGQNIPPAISTSSASPFGTPPSSNASPFATSQFETTNTTAFSKPAFGGATGTTGETFGTTVTSSSSPFGTTVTSSGSPFGTTNAGTSFGVTPSTTTGPFTSSTFSDAKSSPFGPTAVTTTTTTNTFASQQQQISSPFGTFATNSATPFGKSPFGIGVATAIIDDSVYSVDNQLTDDEKSMFLSEKFTFGKIPLKPPTKDIR